MTNYLTDFEGGKRLNEPVELSTSHDDIVCVHNMAALDEALEQMRVGDDGAPITEAMLQAADQDQQAQRFIEAYYTRSGIKRAAFWRRWLAECRLIPRYYCMFRLMYGRSRFEAVLRIPRHMIGGARCR